MGLQIVIPMAGRGQRFRDAGYDRPKPLIDVDGMPMAWRVLSNLPYGGSTPLLLALEEHRAELGEETVRRLHEMAEAPKCFCWIGAVTQGAACTVLLAENYVDDDPLLIANCDQWLDWSPEHFADFVRRDGCDGAAVTFRASGPKWSYADVREDGTIAAIAEKMPISNDGTTGLYYWRRAEDCFRSIKRMMEKGLTTNGEYYIAPSFNEMILDGARIIAYPVPRMWGMGTPDDLQRTLAAHPWRA